MTGTVAALAAAAAVVLALHRVRPPARIPVPPGPGRPTSAARALHLPRPWPTRPGVTATSVPREAGRSAWARRSRRGAATAAGVVILLTVGPAPLLAAAGLAMIQRAATRRREARRYEVAVVAMVAEMAELLVAAVRAGLAPHEALHRIVPALPDPVLGAVREALARTGHGERLADALDRLPLTLGEAARPLARALASADRHGTALAPALELLALEARAERRRRAEEAARRLPVRLSFPLVACFLPALALCTVVPLLAGTLASLRL